ncbi:transglycosylase domain-containing protein [Salisediminibacterium beveridgei]|uniref:Penicillin-binding protein, 1A family n=1 Tax=Salisediminibacterium beveridgei TaxID=632773 RepID=A0A1D7QT08_9BACI|nr:transglycosylase domain-containing protein [Salisediminibacterium beveridgei]AOM82152.1 penicillin-binding protein, 1A family [Salisediminibacterium beveridgei]
MNEFFSSIRRIFSRKEPQVVIKGIRITTKVAWNILLLFITVTVILGAFAGGAAAGYFASLVQNEPIPEFEEMEQSIYNYEEASEVYFADDVLLGDLPSPLDRREASLDDISDHLINAVIATEDEYFFEHEGVVPKALFRALYQDFSNAAIQTGGSTLTQQLIKNQLLTSEVTHDRKAIEILYAMRLEHHFEKEDILEAYMNIVPFGRNTNGRQVAGVEAAARGLFDVSASELSLPQAAYIAGLPQSPFAYTPFTSSGEIKEDLSAGLSRMNTVLNRMYSAGYITSEERDRALDFNLEDELRESQPSSREQYPWVLETAKEYAIPVIREILFEQEDIDLDEVEDDDQRQLLFNRYTELAERSLERDGYQIHTTINKDMYDAQQEVVAEFEYFGAEETFGTLDDGSPWKVPEEGASVLIDNSSGAILSFVAGRDFEARQTNRAIKNSGFSGRQTGSTMKSLSTYPLGFDTGALQPAILAPDTPYDYQSEDDKSVSNFDNTHRGIMTAREALVRSRNVPAVREFYNMDWEAGSDMFVDFGLDYYENMDNMFESLPLGTDNFSLDQMVSAFSTYANDGVRNEQYVIESIKSLDGEVLYEHEPEEVEVVSPQTSYLMYDVMRDVIYGSGGTAGNLPNYLNVDADWAGKTGTSQGVRDALFIALNPNVTMGTWIGYDNNANIEDHSSGISYSIRNQILWSELMNAAYEIDPDLIGPSEQQSSPGGIVEQSVCAISGKLPSDLCREAGLVFTDLFNSEFAPTDEDDSLERVRYVRIDDELYKSLDETPEEFTKPGVSVKEEYFEFADGDITEYLPDDWDDLVPDVDAPDNGQTPSAVTSGSADGSSVRWSEHPEGDVIGYRLYYSPAEDQDPSLVESFIWDDDLSYSAGEGAYFITAVDVSGRESSQSDPVIVGEYAAPEEEEEEEEEEEVEEEPEESDNNDSNQVDNDNNDNQNNTNENNNDQNENTGNTNNNETNNEDENDNNNNNEDNDGNNNTANNNNEDNVNTSNNNDNTNSNGNNNQNNDATREDDENE